MRGFVRLAAVLVALAAGVPAWSEQMRVVGGSAPRALAQLADVGEAAADEDLELTVVLGLRDRAALDAMVAGQQDRRSPHYRRWRDGVELADRFGARRVDYERVRRWFAAQGFTVVRDSGLRVGFVTRGTVGQAAAAFATPMRRFRRNGKTYRGPAADVLLPESIAASVRGVLGLDDLPKFRPVAQIPNVGTALAPEDFATIYRVNPLRQRGLTGAGRSIAVVARSNFEDADMAAFAARYLNPPTLRYRRILVDPSRDPHILPALGEEVEVLLDTQWAGALAPGADVNVVISPRNGDIPDSLHKAVADRLGDVVSISFSLCETEAPRVVTEYFDGLYALANAQGQTVVVASGDSGGTECIGIDAGDLSVNALASSPHAVAVGGTQFTLRGEGAAASIDREAAWNDEYGATGGGESVRFARPPYQVAALLFTPNGGRALPDLALAASPVRPGYVIVEGRQSRIVGGTSVSTPALASVLALINEHLANTTGSAGLGQLLPALYRVGSEQQRGVGPAVFRDISTGSNALVGAGGYDAAPGFDLATGWGTPLPDVLIDRLGAPGPCEPATRCLVPAQRRRRHACSAEWLVERVGGTSLSTTQVCRDGDPTCDADGLADGRCTINVALCVNVLDTRPGMLDADGYPACPARRVRGVRLLSPRRSGRDAFATANRSLLVGALAGLPDLPSRLRTACSATVPVVVPATDGTKGSETRLRARVIDGAGGTTARVDLRCSAS